MFVNDVKYLFREYVNKSSCCFYRTPLIPCVIIGLQYGSVFAGFFFLFVCTADSYVVFLHLYNYFKHLVGGHWNFISLVCWMSSFKRINEAEMRTRETGEREREQSGM